MRYFTFSPLFLEIKAALEIAEPYLEDDAVVHIEPESIEVIYLNNERPRALPETHLVRVEPDGSTRIVDSNFH